MKSITNVRNYRAKKEQVKKWTKMPNETTQKGTTNGSRKRSIETLASTVIVSLD